MQGNFFLKVIFMALFVFLGVHGIAQEDIRINGSVKEKDTNHKMENVQVQVLQDGSNFDSYTTSGSAKFEFDLPLGAVYELKFSKNGYVAKKIQINTKYIPEEDQEGGFRLDLDMTLFEYVEGFDESILEEPIGMAAFDVERNAIEFDFDYTRQITNKIEAEFIRLDNLKDAEKKKREKYEDLMVQGSDNMTKEKYDKAIGNYKEALTLFPDEKEAQDKLEEAERLFALQNKDAELEAQYEAALKNGDDAVKSKDYDSAKTFYEEAKSLKPGEQKPKDKLRDLEKLIAEQGDQAKFDEFMAAGDTAMGSEDFQAAVDNYKSARDIISDDKDMKKKLAEAQEKLNKWLEDQDAAAAAEKRYKDLIDKADKTFESEDYALAINQYSSALELKSDEQYPKDQIEEANRLLEEQKKANEDAAANSAQDEIDQEYDQFLTQANEDFTNEDLESAKTNYEAALGVKPMEKFPKQRIKRIEELLQEKLDQEAESLANSDKEAKEKERLATLALEEERLKALEDEETKRLQEELAEKERLAEEERRRKEEEEDRIKNLASNIDTNAEKRAEEFYRQQKKDDDSERNSKAQNQKEDYQTWLQDKSELAASKGREESSNVESVKSSMTKIYSDGENYQKDKRENFDSGEKELVRAQQERVIDAADRRSASAYELEEIKKERGEANGKANQLNIEQNAEDFALAQKELLKNRRGYIETGEVLRKDNQYQVERSKERLADLADDGERERSKSQAENDDFKDAVKSAQIENRQLHEDRLAVKHEKVENQKLQKTDELIEGAELRKGNEDEVERAKDKRQNMLSNKESNASLQRKIDREEAFNVDRGGVKDYEDYNKVEGTEDLSEGVTERSFEINQGKKLVIERTVKLGNKIDTYLKVIDKNATYYFKNNKSITKGTWDRETRTSLD